MILTSKIKIKTTNKNISHYKILFNDIKSGDEIFVSPDMLPAACKLKILVACDICGKEKNISYFSYTRNVEKFGYYTCGTECANDKTRQTSIEKYGEISFTKTDEYIKKTRQTKLEKYKNEKYINLDKIKETNNKKYGSDWYIGTKEFVQKSKETCLKKYNVESYTQTPEYIEKKKNTKLERHGVENYVNIEKIKETKQKNHNDVNYNNRDKYKLTCLEHFGVENPMQDPFIVQKMYDAYEEKHGVRHHMQIQTIFDKIVKSGLKIMKFRDTELYYQGTYELDFLNKYYDLIDIKRGTNIKYMLNDTEYVYYPDFFISKLNLIVEVKSSYWNKKHIDKVNAKEKACKEQGYNYIIILDKDYTIFDKLIRPVIYNKDYSWQYDIRLKTLTEDVSKYDFKNLKVSDFTFEYVDKNDLESCKDIRKFIERYEWLGNMPNRPTHRFRATYKGILAGVIVMAVPNSFSKLIGDDTKELERLISRGACASWTPKNLASSLIMWSIKWMVKNTPFRLFTAYADPEAKELGTIYQACNFTYLGQHYGSTQLYFDVNNPNIGWTTGRNFRKLSYFKKIAKKNNIIWNETWNENYSILWNNMPEDVKNILINVSKQKQSDCIVRNIQPKHKYVYVLSDTPLKTKALRKQFFKDNEKIIEKNYPKQR